MLYYRRKILLALIEAFDGHLTAKQLQKYLFLFTRKQAEKAFDFIPYYYGCFSFQANQDIMTLAKLGYLSIIKSENGRRIQICQSGNYLMMLDMFEQQAIKEIKEKFVVEFTNKLLQIAISKIEKLREGEIFFVRELFLGYIWNRIPINIRMRLGTQFFNEVNLNHKNEIEVLDKTKSGQQKYKKL